MCEIPTIPQQWMVYNRKSCWNGRFRGTSYWKILKWDGHRTNSHLEMDDDWGYPYDLGNLHIKKPLPPPIRGSFASLQARPPRRPPSQVSCGRCAEGTRFSDKNGGVRRTGDTPMPGWSMENHHENGWFGTPLVRKCPSVVYQRRIFKLQKLSIRIMIRAYRPPRTNYHCERASLN